MEGACECVAYQECATEGDEWIIDGAADFTVVPRISETRRCGVVEKATAQLAGCGLWYPKNEQQWPRRIRNSNRQCPMISQGEISDEEDI